MITLEPDEKIHLIKRRHKYILFRQLIPEILIFLIIVVFMISILFIRLPAWPDWLINFFPAIALFDLSYLLLFLFSSLLQIFWLIIFLTITNYYLDCWIVTNKRTIHTELRALFSRILSSVPHDKIQDITIDIHGIFPTILRFGNLKIQTAGGFREFIFQDIPDPYKTKEIIFQAQKEFLETKIKNGENKKDSNLSAIPPLANP